MKLNRLLLRNFRNYEEEAVLWHPDVNIIYGENAQGKTNLLEAIAYLSLGSSFREQKEEKILNWEKDFFFLEAELERGGEENLLSAGYSNKRKLWKKNGIPCKKMSEIAGFLHTVVFTPEDLEIVKKGPEIRRHFLDREMVQLYSGYHLYLNQYKKALQQRNNLLKQLSYQSHVSQEEQNALLYPWEAELAKSGAFITQKRAEMLLTLNTIASAIHSHLSGQQEQLVMTYQRGGGSGELPAAKTVQEIEPLLFKAYEKKRAEDMKRGITSTGPHRDDFKITINDIDARNYGSQGQQRTAALAIKLSEVELVKSVKGYYPLLLLDDVLSELDHNRRASLLNMMFDKAQIFITTTDIKEELKELPKQSFCQYEIQQGRIRNQ